ncbi:DUF1212-domain-containing protein [Serendipita vermifera]|nr:DUF1212-domain-containing protein [Serendipita vermifera]
MPLEDEIPPTPDREDQNRTEGAVDPDSPRDLRPNTSKTDRHVQWGPNEDVFVQKGQELDEKATDSKAFSSLKNSLLQHRELSSAAEALPTQQLDVFVDSMETDGLPESLTKTGTQSQQSPLPRGILRVSNKFRVWKSEKDDVVEDDKEDGQEYDMRRRNREQWDFRYGGSSILSTLLGAYDHPRSATSSGTSTPYSVDPDTHQTHSEHSHDGQSSPLSRRPKPKRILSLDHLVDKLNRDDSTLNGDTGGTNSPVTKTKTLTNVNTTVNSTTGQDIVKRGRKSSRASIIDEDKSYPGTRTPSMILETESSTPVHEAPSTPDALTIRSDWAGSTLRVGRKRLTAALKALTPAGSRTASPNATDTEDEPKERKHRRKKSKRKRDDIYIAAHVADIIQRQDFVLKLARAFLMFGAPSHRLETHLQNTGRNLGLNVSCMYLPNIVLLSFNDLSTGTSSVRLIKQGSALDLGKLVDAYALYWSVIYHKISVSDATNDLNHLILRNTTYNRWITVAIGGFCSSFICPIAFSGSFLDAVMAFPLGALLVFVQTLAAKNELYNNVFEIVVATFISFVAGALASTGYFCYSAVASASIVLILPGYIILCGALEVVSRNITCGVVRMCYAIIYSLFLGFGLSIGSEVYHQIFGGPVLGGSDYACAASHSVDGQWWRRTASPYWAFLCVPMYSLFLTLRNQSPIWRKELYFAVLVACAGWTANHFASKRFVNRSDISSSLGAFVVGVAGNIYGRFSQSNAFVVIITGILFQIPTGLSNGGLLAFTRQSTEENTSSYTSGFQVAEQLISVSVGLTVGLFVAAVLVHPLPSRRRGTVLFAL